MTISRQALYSKRHQLRKLRGETAYIDTAPARTHLATLAGAGWSIRAIAGAAGLAPVTVSRLHNGQANASPDTLRKILAVNPSTIPTTPSRQTTEPFVPRIGTVRRLQALQYMGWTTAYLREHHGIPPATLYQQGRWVTRTMHDRVAAAYRELSHRLGPSERTRIRARRAGYVSPASWDDIDLDQAPEREEPAS